MAKHTLHVDCEKVTHWQITGASWDYCAVHKRGWPCPELSEYNAEMHRRFLAKRKAPVRLEHGRHSTEGPRDWKS